jgi:ubiquinone/menaquinone biosynthesis C-methylase UbiE
LTNPHEQKDLVQREFGRTADAYVNSESHAKGDDLNLLIDWLAPQPNWLALDIATGGGHVAKALSPNVETVFATDLTKEMLTAARLHHRKEALHNIHYVIADAEALPFLDATFDVVTCRIAPHHFPNPQQFVAEAWRVLRAGGQFLLIDNVTPEDEALDRYFNTFEKMRDESHMRAAPVSEWTSWLTGVGFKMTKSRMRKKVHQFTSWVDRMAASEEQANQVEAYILSGSNTAQSYFSVRTEGDRLRSLQIDEWMVMCTK